MKLLVSYMLQTNTYLFKIRIFVLFMYYLVYLKFID